MPSKKQRLLKVRETGAIPLFPHNFASFYRLFHIPQTFQQASLQIISDNVIALKCPICTLSLSLTAVLHRPSFVNRQVKAVLFLPLPLLPPTPLVHRLCSIMC
jgi:hypothetical protein